MPEQWTVPSPRVLDTGEAAYGKSTCDEACYGRVTEDSHLRIFIKFVVAKHRVHHLFVKLFLKQDAAKIQIVKLLLNANSRDWQRRLAAFLRV